MVANEIEKSLVLVVLGSIVTFLILTPMFPTMYAKEQTKIASANNISTISNRSAQKFTIGANSYSNDINNNNTNEDILHRGIISSEAGQHDQLKVQRTIILQHRQDGKDYTGILTFTASKPVEVLLGHS